MQVGLGELCGNDFGNFDSRCCSEIIPEKFGNNRANNAGITESSTYLSRGVGTGQFGQAMA